MSGRKWTAAEDRTARELAAQGWGLRDVAAELGRSWVSVRDRQKYAGRFGFRRGPDVDAELRASVIEAVEFGCVTSAEVWRRLGGRSRSAYRKLIRELIRGGLLRRASSRRLAVGPAWGNGSRG